MVAGFVSRRRGYMVVRPEIGTPGDLRGKSLGVISIGGAQQRLMQLQNPRLANINPASLTDSTFIRRLDESGFIGQLKARYGERP